jgi:hypothetical protein
MTDLLLLGKPVLRSSGTTGVMVMRMSFEDHLADLSETPWVLSLEYMMFSDENLSQTLNEAMKKDLILTICQT